MKSFHEFLEKYRDKTNQKTLIELGKADNIKFQFFCGFTENLPLQDLETILKKAGITVNTLSDQLPYIARYIKSQKHNFIVYYLDFKKSGFKLFIRFFTKGKTAEILAIFPSNTTTAPQPNCYDELMSHFESIGLSFDNNTCDSIRAEGSVEMVFFEKTDGGYDIYGDICIDEFER